jgi:hypothetical protein
MTTEIKIPISGIEFEKFLHEVIDELCNKKKINISNYNHLSNIELIIQKFKNLFREIVRKKLSKENIISLLQSNNFIEPNLYNSIIECINSRFEEIENIFIIESSKISQSYLSDFDWKVLLTISSDKISN